jgi:branched-chain amino acid transport system ATP-binding protein
VTAAEEPALELRDVHAGYGRIEVLHGVTLSLVSGTVCALLGPNGAGKSTTLQVASGDIRPTAGCVHIGGVHVNGTPPEKLVRAGVCLIPEGRGIFANLTVEENLRMTTFAGDLSPKEVEEKAFARFSALADRRDQLAGTLSGGEQQMLAMSRALATDPDVLLLDEISMGLAPRIVMGLYEVVAQLAAEGISILLVEQFARTALRVADYAAVMTQGRIAAAGKPSDVTELISEAYLGGAA